MLLLIDSHLEGCEDSLRPAHVANQDFPAQIPVLVVQSHCVVAGAHEVLDDVGTVRLAPAVAEPAAALQALHQRLGIGQVAVGARLHLV